MESESKDFFLIHARAGEAKRPGSITFALAVLILLATATVLASLFPVLPCPHRAVFRVTLFETPEGTGAEYPPCPFCGSRMEHGVHEKGRSTLFRWIRGELTSP